LGSVTGSEGVERVDEETPLARAEHFRRVAENLRGLATATRYDFRRRDQLLALADGFQRFADRLEQEAEADTKSE
jgi:hypothetical protein